MLCGSRRGIRGGNDGGHRRCARSTGRSDVRLVSARLRDVPGVISVEVDAVAGVVVVRGSVDVTAVRAALLEVGYLPEPLTG